MSDDGTPILGELKRGPDNLPYYALIQLLVHLVELSSRAQRQRLVDLGVPAEMVDAPMDLYLISYGKPHVTHHGASLESTEEIARKLISGPSGLEPHARRIAYLHATPDGKALAIDAVFVAQ